MAAGFHLMSLLLCVSLSTAQLFPFASLQEYFDHQSRHGPQVGAELATAATQGPPPAADDSTTTTEQPGPAARTSHDGEDQSAPAQAAEESARVASVLRNPGVALAYGGFAPAFALTPPAADAPRSDYAAIASGDAAAALRALAPIPTFDNQRNTPVEVAPDYSSQAVSELDDPGSMQHAASPTYDSQRSGQPVAAAYVSTTAATFDGQRNVQPLVVSALAVPKFRSQGSTPTLSSPQPAPNPYITAPKLALKAVPFNTYPYPMQTKAPYIQEALIPRVTFKPLKLYKNTVLYPKKYRPELEQTKVASLATTSGRDLVAKKTYFPKEDYPLVKQQKQTAHNIAVTKQAASFQKKLQPVTKVAAKAHEDGSVSAKPSTPAITKLLPSAEQSAAASVFSHSRDNAGEESGFVNHHDAVAAGLGPGHERVEFQMYGQQGPHTYKFGFDTGKGHNRQFRYEERDPHGHVKGHYGFYNKHGKLKIVSYTAHPQHGFHADSNFGNHDV